MKRLFNYRGDLLALIAGASLPLAFAPYSLFPIAVLSLAALFILWQSVSPRRAALRGFLYGLGLFGMGVSWVHISFYQFGGVPLVGALLMMMGLVVVMALYPALLGWLVTRFFPDHSDIKWLLVLPAAWTLIEWLRGWFLTGFPWLSLGYGQIDSPLSGFAPLLGVYGVSWLTVLTASLITYSIKKPGVVNKLGLYGVKKWQLSKPVVQGTVLSVLLAIWGGGWLLSRVSWTSAVGEPLKVALIQGNIPQEFKWLSGYQIPSMLRYLFLSQQNRDADMIIWPETAVPVFYSEIPEYAPNFMERLIAEQVNHQTDFLIGIPVRNADGRYFNSVVSISKQPGFYYKHHLVPFGEYIPFSSLFGKLLKLLDVPLSEFSAGPAQQSNLHAAGEAVGVSICYEIAYGELIRNSLPSATLLVNVSNDAWFGDSIAPHQHLQIARMRALENGRYLLRATNTGISAVIDSKGEILAKSSQFDVMTLRASVPPYHGMTPYSRFGNGLIVTLLFIGVLLGGLVVRKNNK